MNFAKIHLSDEAMKTADRENPTHGATWLRNRAHGAVGQNRTSSIEWAEKQEKFQPKEMCFFLTSPFIELIVYLDAVGIRGDNARPLEVTCLQELPGDDNRS